MNRCDAQGGADMAKVKKRSVVHLTGSATAKAKAKLDVRITDPKYDVALLTEDIHFKRVWFESPADADGWMKLFYSADGPNGDPWAIGKVRIYLDSEALDQNFGDFSKLSIEGAKKE
jgi:hypothetical protein